MWQEAKNKSTMLEIILQAWTEFAESLKLSVNIMKGDV